MTARSPRRSSRRPTTPASSLPRPVRKEEPASTNEAATMASPVVTEAVASARRTAAPRRTLGARAHHVTDDYSYVHRDLILVAGVGVVAMAFIVAMSFVI